MKKLLITLVIFSLVTPLMASDETNGTKEESALKIVPLITSSPLLGTGVGAVTSYLYQTGDDRSSKSQLRVGGQYSDTESYNIFVQNNAFFHDNRIIANTSSTFSDINNDFTGDDGGDVEYNARTIFLSPLS